MFAVLDIETGGFSKKKNAIVEVAILFLNSDREIVEEYQTLIAPYPRNPEVAEEEGQLVSYKEDAMAVHGIPMEEIMNGPSAEEVGAKIVELIMKHDAHVIVGHCAKGFDRPWIENFLERFGNGYKFRSCIDTCDLSKAIGSKVNDLPFLCQKHGIEHIDAHRALADCHATLSLWKCLE